MSTTRTALRAELQRRMRDIPEKRFTNDEYNDAINWAIREAWPWMVKQVVDTTTVVIVDDRLTYTLPTDIRVLQDIRIENTSIVCSGTATGSQSGTTLVDTSQSWTTDAYNTDYAVCLTDGTGQGQQRTITDTAATSLTVATWTTPPADGVTEYIIKKLAEETSTWNRIFQYRIEDNAGVLTLRLHSQYESGMSVMLRYVTSYSTLASDGATTDLDVNWILLAGEAYLYRMWMSNIPEHSSEQRRWMLQYNEQEMKNYKVEHATPIRGVQIRYNTLGNRTVDSEYPF